MPIGLRAAVVAALTIAGGAVAIVAAAPAQAATCDATWAGPAGGDWNTATNWSPAAVPTASSQVCVTTAAGPTIGSGVSAQAMLLTTSGTSMRIDGLLSVGGAVLTDTDLAGAGQLGRLAGQGRVDGNLTGVRLGGNLAVSGFNFVDLEGSRIQCGQRSALCLSNAARLQAGEIFIGGDIVGASTARPALTTTSLLFTGAQTRIRVDTSAASVYSDVAVQSARLDQWEQLSADGTLSGTDVFWRNGTLTLPGPIVHLDSPYSAPPGSVVTAAGTDALSELTSVGPVIGTIGLPLPAVVTPRGGRLTIEVGASTASLVRSTTTTIQGAVENDGYLALNSPTTADSLLSSGETVLDAALTVDTATIDGGSLEIPVHTTLTAPGGVTLQNGGTLTGLAKSSCVTIDGALTMTGANFFSPSLVLPRINCSALFSVTGPVSLPNTLRITSSRKSPSVGTREVLIDAPDGISGTFSKITGVTTGANHWAITYSATQVVATVVAGPARPQ